MPDHPAPDARRDLEAGIDRVAVLDPPILRETLVRRIATLPLDEAAARLTWCLLQEAELAGEVHRVAEDPDSGVGVWRAGPKPDAEAA